MITLLNVQYFSENATVCMNNMNTRNILVIVKNLINV